MTQKSLFVMTVLAVSLSSSAAMAMGKAPTTGDAPAPTPAPVVAAPPAVTPPIAQPAGILSFTASSPLGSVVIRESDAMLKEVFLPGSFYLNPTMTCKEGEKDVVYQLNSAQYALKSTADYLAAHLGGTVIGIEIKGWPCTAQQPMYVIRFEDAESGLSIDSNAGLIATSFNRQAEWVALLGLRSEIAAGFYQRVPSWDEAINDFNCGREALGMKVARNPNAANTVCRK